jgi:predicted enzyme involved in methoxymalonyl-ACP biosynthesis
MRIFKIGVEDELLIKYTQLSIREKHALNDAIREVMRQFLNQANSYTKNINATIVLKSEKLEGLERMIQLIQKLYYFKDPCPPLQRQLISELMQEAKKLITV